MCDSRCETERKFMQWVANKNSGRQWEIPL